MKAFPPSYWASMHIHRLKASKSGAMFRFICKDDPKMLATTQAGDKAIDLIIAYWRKLIDEGDEDKIQADLDAHADAERRSDEDEILAQAEVIKKARGK